MLKSSERVMNMTLHSSHAFVTSMVLAAGLAIAPNAFAGGATSGPGLITPTPTTQPPQMAVDRTRFAIALDYALSDQIFKSKSEDLILKLSLAGQVGMTYASFTMNVKKAFELAASDFNNFTLSNVNTIIRKTLELVVFTLAPKEVSDLVNIGEMATAFTVAFTWGYMFGK
jgi:hypothetical protein